MNLPQNATDFLDVFVGYYTRVRGIYGESSCSKQLRLPTIHVYAFSSAADPVLDVAERAAASLQCSLSELGKSVVSTNSLGIVGVSGIKENEKISKAIYQVSCCLI